jgi:hypothetical protein
MSMIRHQDQSSRNDVLPAKRREAQSTTDVLMRGPLAGAAEVAAMNLAEKLEQAITKRPNSYSRPTLSNACSSYLSGLTASGSD